MAVPTGQGVGRALRPPAPRVEHARPFFDEFWRFGLDKGTSIVFGQATRAAGAGAARVVEGVSAVRATHPVLYLTHARAFATYRCGVDGGARGSSGNDRLWQRLCRALAAVVASGSQAERRERKGSDF